MIDVVPVPEAARVLGLSPGRVRAMAAHGQLEGSKVGDRWLIERAALEQRRSHPAPSGRPFAPHNAWALLRLASGEDVKEIDPSVRSRLRRALALEGLEKLAARLVRRAEVKSFHAHPGEVAYLMDDPDLVASGISAAGAHGFDVVSGEEVDGYLPKRKLRKFVKVHALRPAGLDGNVRLRVVPDEAWRFLEVEAIAPKAAVALDLVEDPDPRSSQAGRSALHDVDHGRAR